MTRAHWSINTSIATAVLFGVCSISSPRFCLAAGYELAEQSGEGVGRAMAGAQTGFGDGSEVVLNPAAMTELEGYTTSFSGHIIVPSADFHNEGSSYIPQLGGQTVLGDDDDGGRTSFVPNIYGVKNFENGLAVGFGITTPFGLSTKYNDSWVGRYQALKSDLYTIDLSPAVAYAPTKWISFGANLNVIYADAELTNAVDFGTIGVSALGLPTASRLGLLPQQADGRAKVTGDDWSVGFGAGVLVKPIDSLKIGLTYRSEVRENLSGDAEFTVPTNAQVLTSSGQFVNTGATARVTFPDAINLGGAYDITPEWTWYGNAGWTRWSRFHELRVEFDSAQADSVQDENWDNTWRLGTGTSYQLSKALRLNAGFMWDQSPISDAQHRTPRIPDNDRYWLAGGVSYALNDSLSLAASYAHLFVRDANTDIVASTGSRLTGSWDLGVEIVSLAVVGRF